jgi:predicted histone-like DNA-binding protein
MAVQFEFYKNPVQGEEEGETSYHPRVVNFQHVTTQRLAVEIHSATTFGKAEVEAMLMELSRCMGNHLREGQRVHLDGVGYFQITLQATEPIHSMAAHADKVKFTGKKMTDKVYVRHTGYPGGQRYATPADYLRKKPEFVLEKAVKSMLPRTRLGSALLRNLKVYAGSEHPHAAQAPKTIKLNEIK